MFLLLKYMLSRAVFGKIKNISQANLLAIKCYLFVFEQDTSYALHFCIKLYAQEISYYASQTLPGFI